MFYYMEEESVFIPEESIYNWWKQIYNLKLSKNNGRLSNISSDFYNTFYAYKSLLGMQIYNLKLALSWKLYFSETVANIWFFGK